MKINELISILEEFAPKQYAEDFDNVGLLVGNKNQEITGVLITLDCLESVVDEAIAKNCNTIVSFHPIIFKGLQSITGKNYVEKTIVKAIKNDIAIYAIHTNLDNVHNGVNHAIAQKLNLINTSVLLPKKATLQKLTTYVPISHKELVLRALCNAGAGNIGNYSNCSFSYEGLGAFQANEFANPTLGEKNVLHSEAESCIHVILEKHLLSNVLSALKQSHPYEEVAYEVVEILNDNQTKGMGKIGELTVEMDEQELLSYIQTQFGAKGIRHSAFLGKKINKIAVLGGSGSFAISAALSQKVDAYITADLKYHDFFQAENQILLIDIGHYESEQFTKNLLYEVITKKIPNFAVQISEINTNPIKYF